MFVDTIVRGSGSCFAFFLSLFLSRCPFSPCGQTTAACGRVRDEARRAVTLSPRTAQCSLFLFFFHPYSLLGYRVGAGPTMAAATKWRWYTIRQKGGKGGRWGTYRLSVLGGSFRRRRRRACDHGALPVLAVTIITFVVFFLRSPYARLSACLCASCLAVAARCLSLFSFRFFVFLHFFLMEPVPICVFDALAHVRPSRACARQWEKSPPEVGPFKKKAAPHIHTRPVGETGDERAPAFSAQAMRKKERRHFCPFRACHVHFSLRKKKEMRIDRASKKKSR